MKKARLNRRRYAEIVRLLKSVITDDRQPVERRLRATDRLLDVYDRSDRLAERRAREAARAEVLELTVIPESTPEVTPELTAEEQAERFLEGMRTRVYAS